MGFEQRVGESLAGQTASDPEGQAMTDGGREDALGAVAGVVVGRKESSGENSSRVPVVRDVVEHRGASSWKGQGQ